jgi:uracil-DNA glycosylase family 4
MDERLKDELAAWLEFFRELGIEDFYRREPGTLSKLDIRNLKLEAARHWTASTATHEDYNSNSSVAAATEGVPPIRLSEASGLGRSEGTQGKLRGTGEGGQPAIFETAREIQGAESEPQIQIKSKIQNLSLFEAPPPVRGRETLDQVREDLGDCQRCKLAKGRRHIVFGQGHPHAELVFVGEGPGADEDEQGLPFVGRAGKLLNRMLESVGIRREDVYICNVVKCRPPGNRTPEKDEVDACSPFLFRQLDAIQPRLICCLGAPAVRTVLGLKEGMLKIRGHFYDYGAAKAMATVHPAYVLRNPREEKILREDFEKIRAFLKQSRA